MVRVDNIQQIINEDNWTKSSSSNLDEDGFVMLFKDLFEKKFRNEFPNDFDAWTVKKQYIWINQNMAKFFPNMPQSLQNFIPASFCELAYYDQSIEELPEWMDIDKYRKGQKFVQKNYTAVIFGIVMGLVYTHTFEEELKTVVLGGRRHTPYLGFQKYLSTIRRVLSWCNGDLWIKGTDAYNDMQVTRQMHLAIRKKVCQMDHEQIDAACTFANPWCPDRELLLKDFATACPFEKFGQRPYKIIKESIYKPKSINNGDFAIVQSIFVIHSLLCPQRIGIHDATDEELEAFCHMWRCIGYFLGMDDEYNLCRGSFEEIKRRVSDFHRYWIIENFKELTPEFEHRTRCIVVPLNYLPILYMPYKVFMLIATSALNLNMPHLYKSLNYTEWIAYKIYKIIFYSLKISFIRDITNKIVRKIIDKAANYNSEKLADIHKKSKEILPDFSIY